jgi:filamentous hemagglutinin family protein
LFNARSLGARVLLAYLCGQLALGPQIALAQTAPTPAPADNHTQVTQSANGTPVVNIATPNSAGVSHNRFNSYDVDARGLILNNSATNAVSLIGGGTVGNGNLTNGTANLILNEVIAPNAGSMLAGYQEILGHSAELVIANPWGVTCTGCGFVNTPRVTLTTGVPTLSASGALAGFTITGGQIAIGPNGLDATRQSTLDLLARSISVGGNIVVGSAADGIAGDLQLLAGANHFDYADRAGSAIPGDGATPAFAIDSSMLGGMYADRIRLLVNEHGAGVRTAGNLAARADDLTVSADGRIELRGAASAARDFIAHGSDIQVQLAGSNTYLYGGRDLRLDATGALTFGTGSIGAARDTSFTAASLFDTGGPNDVRFAQNGVLDATLSGALDLSGGYWTASRLGFNAGSATLRTGSVL